MAKTVGIIGLGLLGASLAKGLQAYTSYTVVGYARRESICEAALRDGAVSRAWTDVNEIIEASDIVVFALPPETNARLIREIGDQFRPGQVITDVSSAKEEFAAAVYDSIPEGVRFVSVHPMAGSEKGGYEESHKDLFQRMGWIVLEDPQHEAYDGDVADELEAMGRQLGSRIERIPMAHHDAYLAMVSHMPHMMASIMITAVGGDALGDTRMRLSAGGLRDSTRTASGLPSMWQEIMYGNRHNVLQALDRVQEEMNLVKSLLLKEDGGQELGAYLQRGKRIRDRLPSLTTERKH